MHRGHRLLAAGLVLLAATASSASADPISVEALDNATVQPAGPRGGSSGKAFLNIEGSANGSFASYGVADFNFGTLPSLVIAVNSISISLTQANAAFSATGDVVFSLDVESPPSDIQPGGTSPLAFDGADPGTATDEGQGDLDLLGFGGGPFTYTVGASGDKDLYLLGLTPPNAAALVSRLNNGQNIRIVIGTGDSGVAATWAGHTNSTWEGPTLTIDVKYEDGTPAEVSSWGKIKANYR